MTRSPSSRFDLSSGKRELLQRRRSRESVEATGNEPIPRRTQQGPPPLSFAQQRLWFLDQLDPGSPAYNLPSALRLEGELDQEALRRSFEVMVSRHEVLRTRFIHSVHPRSQTSKRMHTTPRPCRSRCGSRSVGHR